jgi:hypothetical protein
VVRPRPLPAPARPIRPRYATRYYSSNFLPQSAGFNRF